METEIATQAAGDPIINQILIGLVTDACSLTLQRVFRSARERTRRASRKVDVLEAIRWDQEVFSPSIALLAGVADLPFKAAEVRSALESRRSRTVFRQVVACCLLDEYDERRDDLEKLLRASMRSEGLSLSPQMSLTLLDAIHELTDVALRNVSSSPQSAVMAEQAARTVLLQATVESVVANVATLAKGSARDGEGDREWEKTYRRQCVRRHGVIIPPDNNKRTPVPIDDIYVPGRLGPSSRLSDTETVYEVIPALDRHVFLGDPGGGKSTATNAIAHKIASEDSDRIPFVVTLREFGGVMHEESIAAFIDRTLASRYEVAAPPTGFVEEVLRHGKGVVLLDGLDELLDPSKRRVMAEKVELFSNNYPATAVLVTSRRVGYAEAQLDPTVFSALELSSYTDEDVADYVEKWFTLNAADLQLNAGTTVDDVVDAFLHESRTISDLRSNPLLLALLCIIYRGQNYLPRNRVGIYEKCTELLFETWDRSRGLVYDFSFDSYIDSALKHLAYWMFINDQAGEGVTEQQLVREIAEFFADQAYETEAKAAEAAKAFIGFCKGRAWVLTESGLDPNDAPLFTFAHRTFLEFYAASQVTRKYPDPDKLALQLVKRVSRQQWDTVGQLAVQLINRSVDKGAERTISKMISSATAQRRTLIYRANTFTFIARCLQDLPPAPALLRLCFANLASLVSEMYETKTGGLVVHHLEGAFGRLYRQDVSGESVLFSEMETYVRSATGTGAEGFRAGLFVVKSCLRAPLTDDERKLFTDVFVDSWNDGESLELDSLRIGWFLGVLEVDDIAAKAIAVGRGPLDPWFVNFTANDLSFPGAYWCLGFSMINLDRLGPAVEDRTRLAGKRWFGALAHDVGAWLMRRADGAFASRRSVLAVDAVMALDVSGGRHFELSTEQATTALVLTCIVLEMIERQKGVPRELINSPRLIAAMEARRAGEWDPEALQEVTDSPILPRLHAWAQGSDSFLVDMPDPSR